MEDDKPNGRQLLEKEEEIPNGNNTDRKSHKQKMLIEKIQIGNTSDGLDDDPSRI